MREERNRLAIICVKEVCFGFGGLGNILRVVELLGCCWRLYAGFSGRCLLKLCLSLATSLARLTSGACSFRLPRPSTAGTLVCITPTRFLSLLESLFRALLLLEGPAFSSCPLLLLGFWMVAATTVSLPFHFVHRSWRFIARGLHALVRTHAQFWWSGNFGGWICGCPVSRGWRRGPMGCIHWVPVERARSVASGALLVTG
mmetsp:Transcript_7625/g.28061  ORF Transcript_7625/g.28061 Transcript_7625/m.28061 type:complete len:201 (+) Transcript_7625:1088-1690(+)